MVKIPFGFFQRSGLHLGPLISPVVFPPLRSSSKTFRLKALFPKFEKPWKLEGLQVSIRPSRVISSVYFQEGSPPHLVLRRLWEVVLKV